MKRMQRAWLSLAGFVVGMILLVVTAHADSASTKGGTLRISSVADFDSVDPAVAYQAVAWMFESATCAQLYNYPDKPYPAGATVIPEVATSFPNVSRDGKTQTIKLRRAYRFHTGARITAANYVAAFNRDANQKMQSPATAYLHEIVGADAVIEGKAKTISGVKARGPYALQIRTTRRLPDLVSRLTMPFFCPIATRTPLREISNPLGSGPYYVRTRVENRQTVLERNPFYHGSRPANVDRIVWSVGLGQEACRERLELDELDWCFQTAPEQYREIAATYGINRPNGRFFVNPTLETTYFALNHERPAFKGPGQIPLKQAINWAIDRPALARAAGYLGAKRTDQILPPAIGASASLYPLGAVTGQSLTKARALLQRAKFKPKKLTFYAATAGGLGVDAIRAQIFQSNLKRLGIEVEIKYFSFEEVSRRTGTRGEPFDVTIGSWFADYADAGAFFLPLLSGLSITKSGNSNIAYFNRPKYSREIERIDALTGAVRRKAWARLDVQMMRDDPPWAPFENITQRDFVSKSFGCYLLHPAIGRINLVAACKK